MSSCCDTADTLALPAEVTVALAGNPNSGKTTVFNALTGLRQKVANYPGVTVEKKTGRCKLPAIAGQPARRANIIDLPGTYSLISRSPDEQVAMEVLRGLRKDTPAPDVVIVVVDASNLQRNLYLVSQLVELGRPLVVALNMMDIAERRGLVISPEKLEAELGVPVVPVVGHKRRGIEELKAAIARARIAPMPDWPLPDAMRDELMTVSGGLAIIDSREGKDSGIGDRVSGIGENARSVPSDPRHPIPDTRSPIPDPRIPIAWICRPDTGRKLDRYQAVAERLLIGDKAADLDDVARQQPVISLLSSATERLARLGIDPMQADIEAHYRWIDTVANRVISQSLAAAPASGPQILDYAPARTLTQKVDRILIHKVWGLMIFALIMGTLFVTLFWAADPIMKGLQWCIDWLADVSTRHLSDGPIKDLLVSGVFKGVGTVIVFVPQIAMLFLFLSILEDTGYLARAAFLMDRLLAKVGLHGKSFIPLLSSFACAIPGIMATRTIESRKDRLATILVAPFMSCSARLPVYTLLIGTFFVSFGAFAQAGVMLACYALGIIAAAGTAWVFKRSFMKGAPTAFILELPTYKLPQASEVGRQVWKNTWAFITKAGTTIFCLSIILWAMAYYPRLPEGQAASLKWAARDEMYPKAREYAVEATEIAQNSVSFRRLRDMPLNPIDQATGKEIVRTGADKADFDRNYRESALRLRLSPEEERSASKLADRTGESALAAAQSEYSIAGRMGHAMEPILKPLGFDWKMGVGLVGAFAAREVFVSTLGIVYSVGEVEHGQTQDLASAMRADHYANGKLVWTPLVAVSLLVWFVLAMQCMSTVAIVRRETGGWRWPIFMIVYMNALAWIASLTVFQLGRLLLHA